MVWVLLGLVIGCLVYTFSIYTGYTLFVQNIRPQIETLEEKAETLEQAADFEVKQRREIVERVEVVQQQVIQQQHEVMLVQEKIRTAKQRLEKLEMDMYKKEFKRSRNA